MRLIVSKKRISFQQKLLFEARYYDYKIVIALLRIFSQCAKPCKMLADLQHDRLSVCVERIRK